QNCGYARPSK
ncbi:pyruvate kinase, barrel domain protein, partial [Vibrio parahaemolyticus V-223/04]